MSNFRPSHPRAYRYPRQAILCRRREHERVGLLGRVLALWFRLEPSPRRHRGGRRHRRGREQPAPVQAVEVTNVPPDGVLLLKYEATGEVLTSSVGNVAFLLGFQRLKPEQQVGVLVDDPCALVERID